MKSAYFAILPLLALLASCGQTHDQEEKARQFIDLTYAFDDKTIYWPTAQSFKLDTVFVGENPKGFHYEANNFSAAEHGGTHLDAPAHFFAGRYTTEAVPLEQLIGDAALVDVTKQCRDNPDYRITADDIKAWESANGRSVDDLIVLLRTGFGQYWPDRKKYMGTDELGETAVAKLHFPGLHPDAAAWLVNNRTIKAIGLDTPSIDYGQSQTFGSHVTLFEHNIPAFENVANLDRLPAAGFQVIALPMKIKGGSGGPLRIIAILD